MYVYEVPADFTSGTHQRRYRDHECVPRTYKGDAARFTSWYYSLEATFHEYLMRSAHRTTDPAEADFFYAPAYVACYHLKYNHPSPRQTTETLPEPKVRPHGALIRWRALASYLRERLAVPEFAAARAARGFAPPAGDDGTVAMDLSDHVFVAPYDEGACATPEELKTATFLTHWGNTGVPHDESTTGFGNDDWSGLVRAGILPAAAEAPMRCYDPAKDLVVPPWNRARDETTSPSRWARGRRLTLFFFAGDLGTAEGIPNSGPHASEKYSMGIRQRVAASLRDRFPEFDIAGRVRGLRASRRAIHVLRRASGGRMERRYRHVPSTRMHPRDHPGRRRHAVRTRGGVGETTGARARGSGGAGGDAADVRVVRRARARGGHPSTRRDFGKRERRDRPKITARVRGRVAALLVRDADATAGGSRRGDPRRRTRETSPGTTRRAVRILDRAGGRGARPRGRRGDVRGRPRGRVRDDHGVAQV